MRKDQRGLTLIELMITILVLAVLLGIAIPSFQTTVENNRVLSRGEDLATALSYARSEALRRSERVSVCASSDGLACGANWSDGFIVTLDTATANSAPNIPANGVLRIWDAGLGRTTVNAGGTGFVRFMPTGVAEALPATLNINVAYPDCIGERARRISVGVSGTVSVARANCP